MTTSLDVFDAPIKQSLDDYVKIIGHLPSDLSTIIYASIDSAKKQLGDSWKKQNDRLIRSRIEWNAKIYIDGVLSQSKIWNDCRERIKAYKSIILAGAGLSYASDMPLANILPDILNFINAKNWAELRSDPQKCLAFKHQFKSICGNNHPSKAHDVIILNFPEYVLEIISCNWDNLMEKAATAMGITINKQNQEQIVTNNHYLWKFHGDIDDIRVDNILGQGGWVFPDEQGHVFDSFRQYVNSRGINGQLFTFLIIGYSEQEKIIHDEIVALFQSSPPRPTYRIAPSLEHLNKPSYIIGTADFILPKIMPK